MGRRKLPTKASTATLSQRRHNDVGSEYLTGVLNCETNTERLINQS